MANKVVLLGDNICCYYFNYTGFFPQTNSTSTSALLPYTKYMPSPALLAHNTQPLNLTRPNPSTTLESILLLLFPTVIFSSITCKIKKVILFSLQTDFYYFPNGSAKRTPKYDVTKKPTISDDSVGEFKVSDMNTLVDSL